MLGFDNTILDQLVETGGTLNYCLRYESSTVLSAANRDKLEAALELTGHFLPRRIDRLDVLRRRALSPPPLCLLE